MYGSVANSIHREKERLSELSRRVAADRVTNMGGLDIVVRKGRPTVDYTEDI